MYCRMELADWSRLRHAPSTQTAVRGLAASETAAVSRSEVPLLPPTGVLLVRTIGADAPLRPFLRRGFDGVVQSAMP